jgi:tRNA threonylcarbamoyladenosine modification (KEOPS) complex Cgi121 subunit
MDMLHVRITREIKEAIQTFGCLHLGQGFIACVELKTDKWFGFRFLFADLPRYSENHNVS